MEAYDAIGHLAYALILFGNIRVGQRHEIGWAARFIGESAWVGIGIYLGTTSIWFWGIIFAIIDVRTWIKWRHENAAPV